MIRSRASLRKRAKFHAGRWAKPTVLLPAAQAIAREEYAWLSGYDAARRDMRLVHRVQRVKQTPRVHFRPSARADRFACGRLLVLGQYVFVCEGVPDHRAITCEACRKAIQSGRA